MKRRVSSVIASPLIRRDGNPNPLRIATRLPDGTLRFHSITIIAMLISELRVRGRIVRLFVQQCGVDGWRWRVYFSDTGDIIDEGAMQSSLAAQVASQLALEKWVRRKYKGRVTALEYRWTELRHRFHFDDRI